jgi:hypothetical protein
MGSAIEASVLGGIRGDNDTFEGVGFVVENAALEGDLLWVGSDKERLVAVGPLGLHRR